MRVPLEIQLEKLGELGLNLEPAVGIEDLLDSYPREDLEEPAFQLLLAVLGFNVEREPYDQPYCARAWNFDTECIYGTGDYVGIVNRLLQVAGKPENYFSEIEDSIDFDSGEAWLQYRRADGVVRHLEIEVNDDWVDQEAISKVMGDIESDDSHFYSKDNGQARVLYYLEAEAAEQLEDLAPGQISRVEHD
jgi:hypothetical protein